MSFGSADVWSGNGIISVCVYPRCIIPLASDTTKLPQSFQIDACSFWCLRYTTAVALYFTQLRILLYQFLVKNTNCQLPTVQNTSKKDIASCGAPLLVLRVSLIPSTVVTGCQPASREPARQLRCPIHIDVVRTQHL